MMIKYGFYSAFVDSLTIEGKCHALAPFTPIDGAFALFQQERWLMFCSHDYLGLAQHPEVKKGAMRSLLQHGITTSSECPYLYTSCQRQLEQKLSQVLQREEALLFSSRQDANVTALSALGHEKAAFFLDEKSHPSLFQGAHESLATVHIFKDLPHLEDLLKQTDAQDKILITEAVYSLTADVAPLMGLIALSKKYQTLLYVDDSHAFGVMGPEGNGLCAHLKDVDIIAGSFSKACGAYGGFIVCPKMIRDYLINMHPSKTHYLFPPPLIGALETTLELLGQLEGERKQLQQRSHWLRQALTELGFTLSKPNIPLISLPFNNREDADSLLSYLQEEKILVGPIRRAPTEPVLYQLNLVLTLDHMPDHLTRLVEVIKSWQKLSSCIVHVAKC